MSQAKRLARPKHWPLAVRQGEVTYKGKEEEEEQVQTEEEEEDQCQPKSHQRCWEQEVVLGSAGHRLIFTVLCRQQIFAWPSLGTV
eukprot:5287951-Pyramimonas_sp.AAC.1